tara:strand:+ start:524 stop:796 length:273 start_codon:yes stop_codon:yes gene_type:complete
MYDFVYIIQSNTTIMESFLQNNMTSMLASATTLISSFATQNKKQEDNIARLEARVKELEDENIILANQHEFRCNQLRAMEQKLSTIFSIE